MYQGRTTIMLRALEALKIPEVWVHMEWKWMFQPKSINALSAYEQRPYRLS